jgi:hypothetical protein
MMPCRASEPLETEVTIRDHGLVRTIVGRLLELRLAQPFDGLSSSDVTLVLRVDHHTMRTLLSQCSDGPERRIVLPP